MNLFKTDFYQMSMTVAYILCDRANDRAGFECFVRDIRKDVNPSGFGYYFKQKHKVLDFIDAIRTELRNKNKMFDLFWDIVEHKVDHKYYQELKTKWMTLETEFQYNTLENYSTIKPYIPVFQYNGPRWIGQLLESSILNFLNGKIGLDTSEKVVPTGKYFLPNIVYGNTNTPDYLGYISDISKRIEEFNSVTPKDKLIMEAGFRRAPGYQIANDVSRMTIERGWAGTSNVAAYLEKKIDISKVGGTFAHSFVMSFEDELDSFKVWNHYFPNTTILVDTYNTVEAVKKLIRNNIKPSDIRIDSEPLEDLAIQTRTMMDDAGWKDVGIYLSGDLTPERIKSFCENGIPFNKYMVGTKLLNIGELRSVNCGFVYKLVEQERDGIVTCPEKKSKNKISIGGLKKVVVDRDKKTYSFERGFDLSEAGHIMPDMNFEK